MKLIKFSGVELVFALITAASLICSSSNLSAQPCATPPIGLVSWWAGENSANDETGANHGTLQNGTTFTTGKVGLGFSFDGVDDYVSAAASPSLDVGSGAGFTIEFWMKPNDVTSQQCLVEWNDGVGGIGMHLFHSIGALGGLGSVFANVSDVSGNDHYIATSPGLLSTVDFQHIALTYDRATGVGKIFYNGVAIVTQNLGVFTPQTSYPLYLGTRASGLSAGSYFNGLMDEVSIYNRALSDSEVLAIFDAGMAGKCKNGPPTILSQPESRMVAAGATVEFSVAASGLNLSYQWQFNSADLVGATNALLLINNVQTNQAGNYSVIVTNAFGSLPSSNAVLTVVEACIPATSGLADWWPGDGSGDDLFGGNTAVLHGGMTFINGKVNQAFAFDGVDDYAAVSASASTDVGSGDGFTIECWIKPANVTVGHVLVEWNNGSGPGVQFWTSVPGLGGNGSLFANIVNKTNGTSHVIASPAGILNITNFQHVAVAYNRTNGVAKLYLNGGVVASQTIGVFRPQTTYPLYFGKRVSGATPSYYQGAMDEVALYRRALTDAEILSIYNADTNGRACTPPEILAHPQGKVVSPGSNVTFSATARGTEPLIYQWKRNGIIISGATNNSVTLSNVQPSQAGSISLHVTNAIGFADSSNAVLKVNVVSATGNGLPLTNSIHSFGGPVTIQLLNGYAGGLIFYTLDGSTPSFASSEYTGPFVVTQNVILRAIGYRTDFFESGELEPITILVVPTYSLFAVNSGGGTVAFNPATGPYLSNTVVSLTATPSAGWQFLQWLGDASGTNSATSVTLNRKKSVQAVFGTTLSTTAAGGGSVTLNPSGGVYPYGTTLQLSAIPQAGNYFALWGNAASGNVNPLVFVLTNANPTVSSLFSAVGGGQSALTVVPIGRGRVSVTPRANVYSTGAGVTITATPDAGQSFIGWSGDAAGAQHPLSTTVNSNKIIYANFTKRPALIAVDPFGSLRKEGVQLTITGDSGEVYQLYASTNLANWLPLINLTNSYGTAQFVDSTGTNFNSRFYRAVTLP